MMQSRKNEEFIPQDPRTHACCMKSGCTPSEITGFIATTEIHTLAEL